MSDLRSLMKASKAAARISHPYARYSSSGQLSCTLCGIPCKDVLWPSHLTSKVHRSNIRRQKQEEEDAAATAAAAAASGSRKRSGSEEAEPHAAESSKRMRLHAEQQDAVDGESPAAAALPAGFFDAPKAGTGATSTHLAEERTADEDEPIDEEWAAFEATLNEDNDARPVASTSASAAYAPAATFTAQPKLFEQDEDDDGKAGQGEEGDAGAEPEEEKESEADRREREEREELMERIEMWVPASLPRVFSLAL